MQILRWMNIRHTLGDWNEELVWICQQTKGKSARARLLKLAATAVIYVVWNQRNMIVFQKGTSEELNSKNIMDIISYRAELDFKLANYCNML